MNLFFLIIPLLLIPGLAYAEVGSNFDTVNNLDGTITWTSHFERILNDQWEYKDYIFTDEANYLQVETAQASVQLDKNTCEFSFYNTGIIGGKSPILIDDIIPYQSVDGSGVWNKINGLDNATCVTSWDGSNLKASKIVIGLGVLEYTYKFTGTSWKTELKVTNLSGLNDRLFGFEEVFNLNSDTINYGGSQKDLNNLDGSVFNRTFLETNEAKVIDLLNGVKFDFNLGFDNLNKVWINDTGVNSSLLTFQYFFNQSVLPDGETLIIDPTFNYLSANYDAYVRTINASGAACPATSSLTTVGQTEVNKGGSGDAANCTRTINEWDITSIPDDVNIITVGIRYEVTGEGNSPTCDFTSIEAQPSTLNVQQTWDDIGDGTVFVSNDSDCDNISSGKILDLGTSSPADLQANLVSDWWGLGVKLNNEVRGGSQVISVFASATFELTATYSSNEAVTDLIITDERGTAIDLSWTEPTLLVGAIDGYQINFTTPHNLNVASIVSGANNTGSTATSYTVSGLLGQTNYSFRVGAWNTLGGINASGNVVNGTTGIDPTSAFTPGTFNVTDTGTDIRDIRFDEITVNPTTTRLNVTFPDTFTNLKCDFSYEFAITNRTYENLASVPDPVVPGYNETTFLFNNVQNEIITAYCWNNSDGNGTYIIAQNSIPFVNQIKQFQAGDFGTSGDFGGLDLVSLLVFGVIATIGFNRKNEAVGAVFLLFLTFGLSWFGIITIPTAMGGIIAVIILLVVVQVRKD